MKAGKILFICFIMLTLLIGTSITAVGFCVDFCDEDTAIEDEGTPMGIPEDPFCEAYIQRCKAYMSGRMDIDDGDMPMAPGPRKQKRLGGPCRCP